MLSTTKKTYWISYDNISLVEDIIKSSNDYLTKTKLYKLISSQIKKPNFEKILNYFYNTNKIMLSEDSKIIWISSSNLLRDSIRKGAYYFS
ncbi:MAG: hypothetical protein V1824_02355 [archaeon]